MNDFSILSVLVLLVTKYLTGGQVMDRSNLSETTDINVIFITKNGIAVRLTGNVPVGEIDNKVSGAAETVTFPAGYTEIGPVMKKLRETLTGIQSGAVEDKHNWVYTVA